MSTPDRATFRPTLVALEERVVPAWWTLFAVDTAAGTPGDGTATVTGDLMLAPALDPSNSGQVTIQADTAEAAIGSAVTGLIHIVDDSRTTDLGFSADQVSTASQQRPFAVAIDGDWATISLEGSAAWPGATYAYDDQSWLVRIAPAEAPSESTTSPPPVPTPVSVGGIVFSGAYTLVGGEANETATVNLTVTRRDPDHFLWNYSVHNDNLSVEYGDWTPGIDGFSFTAADASGVTEMATSMANWVAEVNPSTGLLTWHAPVLGAGAYLTRGGTAEFTFLTPPVPPAPAQGVVSMGGHYVGTRYVKSPLVPEGPMQGPGVPLTAKLESVKFTAGPMSRTNSFWIDEDPNDAPYIKDFHWFDKDLDGLINHAGDHQLPVGFVRNSKVYVEANIKLTTGGDGLQSVLVKADNSDGYNLAWTEAPVVNGYVKLPKTLLKKQLPNKVDYVKDFNFKWTIEPIHEPLTIEVGTSTNELFVTLATPKPPRISYIDGSMQQTSNPRIYVTPLWLFCSGAAGSADIPSAATGTFKPFESKDVKSYDDPDKLRNDPSLKMHYYKNWKTTHRELIRLFEKAEEKDATGKTTAVYYDGQCNAWTDLLRQCFLEGGIPNYVRVGGVQKETFTHVRVVPLSTGNGVPNPNLEMWIKMWTPVGNGPNYINSAPKDDYVVKVGGDWKYAWPSAPQFKDDPGIMGQDTDNPLSLFYQHSVVRYPTANGVTIYDPSYGIKSVGVGNKAYFSACQQWEIASLDGVSKAVTVGGATRRWTITKTDYTNANARYAISTDITPWSGG